MDMQFFFQNQAMLAAMEKQKEKQKQDTLLSINAGKVFTKEEIRLKFLSVVFTFNNMMQYSEMVGFANNKSNEDAIYEAYKMYGLPQNNRGVGGSWKYGFWKFYCLAKLYAIYPVLDLKNKSNCARIKELTTQLEVEVLNARKVLGGDPDVVNIKIEAINDLQGSLNAAYANMSCSVELMQNQQQQTLQAITTATAEPTETTTQSTSKNAIVIVALLLVGVIIYKIFKR
jgi:hypothetical protein